MAIEQGVAISIGGGLDKTSSSYELFKTPGVATRLRNYEASMEGGYRRINGFRQYVISPVVDFTVVSGGAGYSSGATANILDPDGNGSGATATVTVSNGAVTGLSLTAAGSGYQTNPIVTITTSPSASTVADITVNINTPTAPTGEETPINGIYPYKEGFWVCQNGNIYWGENGYEWTQVNKDYGTASAGATTTQQTTEEANNTWTQTWATAAQLASKPAVTLSTTARYQFSEYIPAGVPDARITAVNGTDAVVYLETKLVSGTRNFRFHRGLYDTWGLSKSTPVYTDIPKPQYTTVHLDHTLLGAWSEKPETLYYSTRYDDADFTGASAGSINVGDKITGLRTFRGQIIVFAVNSLSRLLNITSSSTIAMQDITKNIGCLDGFSIAEIGGDLVFLAPDGIRTLAGTVRIGDVELGTVSRSIQPVIKDIADNIGTYTISTIVIRDKSQYRLYYGSSATGGSSRGIIGTLKTNEQGFTQFQWSETVGIDGSAAAASGFNYSGVEKHYHGDYAGGVFNHDTGDNLLDTSGTATNIVAEYQTPDLDYGDLGTLKTLKYVKISATPEGTVATKLRIRYNFDDPDTPQPSDYSLSIDKPSIFGTAAFGATAVHVFGASSDPITRQVVEGSGHSNYFRIFSDDQNSPYTVNGLYIDYVPSGRQ